MAATHVCRHCGEALLVARLPGGEWLALEVEPDRRGQVILLGERRCFPVDPRFSYGEDVHSRRHWNHRTRCRFRLGLKPRPEPPASVAVDDDRLERVRAIRATLGNLPGS